MKLSTKSRYGTRLMLDLAEHGTNQFVQLKDVSRRQEISLKYLEQIVIPLKRAKYLVSARGAGGGYRLARAPQEITVGEIVALLEGGKSIAHCATKPEVCDRAPSCLTRNLWVQTGEVLFGKLDSVTLSDLIKNQEQTRRMSSRVNERTCGELMRIVSIAVSNKKGTRKTQVESAELYVNHGVIGDAHAGTWERQVSFLAAERIEECKARGLKVTFGDFAENIATEGIDWKSIPLGSRFRLGDDAVVEITKIGKECHKKCAIYYQAGDCIMPREGVFARVLEAGTIRCGDPITPLPLSST